MSALSTLGLAAAGLPVVVGGVAWTARRLVEGHADRTAAEIRAQHAQQVPAQTVRRPADRPKELTR